MNLSRVWGRPQASRRRNWRPSFFAACVPVPCCSASRVRTKWRLWWRLSAVRSRRPPMAPPSEPTGAWCDRFCKTTRSASLTNDGEFHFPTAAVPGSCPGTLGRAASFIRQKALLGFGFGVDFQADVNLRPIVELADGFRAAFVVVELGINFIIDAGQKRWKTVGAVGADDVGFHRAGVRVRQVDDRVRQRIVAAIEHLAREQAGLVFPLWIAAKQLRWRPEKRCRQDRGRPGTEREPPQQRSCNHDDRFSHEL